ncbi:AAA family ATPase [Bacteroides finegoldii]|nr:AAA family ATPase [Bacteroides finegoldii]
MLTFRLIKKCWQDASYYKQQDMDFLLEENDWNDYHYYTTYHLHVTCKRATQSKGAIYLGPIQIMKLGQEKEESELLRAELKGKDIFQKLPENFFSMTFSIDTYKGLARYLNDEERKEFIQSFRLILKENDAYYSAVKEDQCFLESMLRSGNMKSYSLIKGRELLLQEGMQYNLREKNITIKYTNSDTPVTLDFSAIKKMESSFLPNGVVAFIGKNGSGKSTALYNLAALLYANPSDRNRYMTKVGIIEPSDLGISQLMIFSYTPFDNFILPGENVDSDLILWAKNIEEREGRFVFCGLRDVKTEAEQMIEQKKHGKSGQQEIRTRNVCLKPQSALASESMTAYKAITDDKSKQNDWNDCFKSMRESQTELFQIARLLYSLEFDETKSWNSIFHDLSTGHKFFFHSMLHIIAYCEENAMLLFDEPENHLQAPLLSFMMAEIRKVLAKRNSVMLIATHSPVILQETMANNVRIVRRNGENVSFVKPSIETFGENFGVISSEVFDLTTDKVQYFNAIDEVYQKLDCRNAKNTQQAVDAIERQMNGISSQTIQYVVMKYVNDNRQKKYVDHP